MYDASYFGLAGIQIAVKGGFPGRFVQTLLKVSLEISYGYILLTALPVGKSAGLDNHQVSSRNTDTQVSAGSGLNPAFVCAGCGG